MQFCKLAAEKLGLPVKRLVRGHDHVPDRWQEYRAYADAGFPVLTVNAMGRWLDGDAGAPAPAAGRRAARPGPPARGRPGADRPGRGEQGVQPPGAAGGRGAGAVKLVLQFAMCGTQHPVGTPACGICRASGRAADAAHVRLPVVRRARPRPEVRRVCAPPPQPAGLLPYELVDDFLPVEVVESEGVALSLDPEDEVGVDLVADGGRAGMDWRDGEVEVFEATLADEEPGEDDEVLIDEELSDLDSDEEK